MPCPLAGRPWPLGRARRRGCGRRASPSRSQSEAPGSRRRVGSNGLLLLVAPAAACLVAAVSRGWRDPDRWRPGTLAAALAAAWSLAEWDNPDVASAVGFSLGLACYASAPAVVLHTALAVLGADWTARWWPCWWWRSGTSSLSASRFYVAVLSEPAASGCGSCANNLWNSGGTSDRLAAAKLTGVWAGLV